MTKPAERATDCSPQRKLGEVAQTEYKPATPGPRHAPILARGGVERGRQRTRYAALLFRPLKRAPRVLCSFPPACAGAKFSRAFRRSTVLQPLPGPASRFWTNAGAWADRTPSLNSFRASGRIPARHVFLATRPMHESKILIYTSVANTWVPDEDQLRLLAISKPKPPAAACGWAKRSSALMQSSISDRLCIRAACTGVVSGVSCCRGQGA